MKGNEARKRLAGQHGHVSHSSPPPSPLRTLQNCDSFLVDAFALSLALCFTSICLAAVPFALACAPRPPLSLSATFPPPTATTAMAALSTVSTTTTIRPEVQAPHIVSQARKWVILAIVSLHFVLSLACSGSSCRPRLTLLAPTLLRFLRPVSPNLSMSTLLRPSCSVSPTSHLTCLWERPVRPSFVVLPELPSFQG